MIGEDPNIQLDSTFTYSTYSQPVAPSTTIINTGDTIVNTTITTISGNSGKATGPAVTISGGSTGYSFTASAGTITLTVANATTVRTSISAAKSGTNADITSFTGLLGNTGFNAWTGTPNQATHATYSGTASVGYVQAELQGVMDSLQ